MENQGRLQEVLKKVRQLEIKAKGLTNHIFAGEYHTSFKGKGMSFSEVRDYAYGDDVRNIDWNVTARYQNPYIKVFEEERELNVFLIIDTSSSGVFGSSRSAKFEIIAEVASLIAFSALKNNDKVGVIFFNDEIEYFIPPKKGKAHVLRIILDILLVDPKVKKGTNISKSLEYFNSIQKRKSIVFLISDFFDSDYNHTLGYTSRYHDLVGVKIWDKHDEDLPNLGFLKVKDAETGNILTLDTGDKATQRAYNQNFLMYKSKTDQAFRTSGTDLVEIRTDEDYIKIFQTFFKKRMKHK